MQRSLAVLLIIVFALSQYARLLGYLQCRLINKFSTTVQHCDCEKQNFAEQPASKEFPVAKAQIHPAINDFYTAAKEIISVGSAPLLPGVLFACYNQAPCRGNYGELYRPPRYYIFTS